MFTDISESESISPEYLDENFTSLVAGDHIETPQNYQAEEAILGAILLNTEAMPRAIAAGLREDSFYYPQNKTIYKVARKLYSEGKPTDMMNVTARLYDTDKLVQVGGQSKIAELAENPWGGINIESYVQLINEKAWKRDARKLASQISMVAYDKTLSPETAKGWLSLKLDQLTKSPLLPIGNAPTNSTEYISYNRIISELRKIEFDIEQSGFRYFLLQKLAKRYKMNLSNLTELYAASQTDHITGKSYTIAELIHKYGQQERQWLMTGLLPKQGVTVLHAIGGVGKTRLAYNLACNLVAGADWGDFGVTGFDHRILIYQTDETMGNTITTLREMGYDVNGPNVRVVDHWSFNAIPQLIREVDSWKPTMVIIDSITSNNWQSPHEESNAAYAKPLLVLKDVAQGIRSQVNPAHPDQGLAWGHKTQFLVVHHSNVGGRARGTTAIVNSATQVISIKRVQEHGDLGVLVFEKSRDKISEQVLIQSDPNTKRWNVLNSEYEGKLVHLTGEYAGGDLEAKSPDRARDAVVKFLRQHPNTKYTIKEIQDEIGGDVDYIRAICGKLAALGRIEKRPGSPGYANTYYFKADVGFSIDRVATLSKKDHPQDHPQDSDTITDSSEGSGGDLLNVVIFKNKNNNFSEKDHHPPSDFTGSPETVIQTGTKITGGGDLGGDHPHRCSASPLIESSTEGLEVILSNLNAEETELLEQLKESIASEDPETVQAIDSTINLVCQAAQADKAKIWAALSNLDHRYGLALVGRSPFGLPAENYPVTDYLIKESLNSKNFQKALELASHGELETALEGRSNKNSRSAVAIWGKLNNIHT